MLSKKLGLTKVHHFQPASITLSIFTLRQISCLCLVVFVLSIIQLLSKNKRGEIPPPSDKLITAFILYDCTWWGPMLAYWYLDSMTTLSSYGYERCYVHINIYMSMGAEFALMKLITWRDECGFCPSLPIFISLLASNSVQTLREYWKKYHLLSKLNSWATCSFYFPITGVVAIVY